MRSLSFFLSLAIAFPFLVVSGSAQISNKATVPLSESTLRGAVMNPLNPKAFQGHMATPSSTLQFWLSPDGAKLVRNSNHPNLKAMLQRFGVDMTSAAAAPRSPGAPHKQAASGQLPAFVPCNFSTGSKFNLEPASGMPDIGIAAPQNEESVDFIPGGGRAGADLVISGANDLRGVMQSHAANDGIGDANPYSWGLSNTGYYVARDGGCGPSFEGGLPHIHDEDAGEDLYGLGDPVISADTTRGNVYAADLRDGLGVTGLGLFRTTSGLLNSETACPSGTHVGDANGSDVTASACWPVGILVGAGSSFFSMVDKPHIKVDERRRGSGAGNIYVSWTQFGFHELFSGINLAVCKSDFTSIDDCSEPIAISGDDSQTQFSHMVVRPDGILSVTYVNSDGFFDPDTGYFLLVESIRYVTCQPQEAPQAPLCSDPVTVGIETQPIFAHLASNAFRVATYPVHDVRVRNGHTEEFIAWARCHENTFVPIGIGFGELFSCPQAEVVYSSSLTDSTGAALHWSNPVAIPAKGGDQFFPWVSSDRSTGAMNVQYYSSENDAFHHRLQVMVSTINPSQEEFRQSSILLSSPNEPDIDVMAGPLFYGDYLGLSSRSGSSYSATTFSNFGLYGRSRVLGQDNVLTGFKPLNQANGGTQ